jgi:hypothetical protein
VASCSVSPLPPGRTTRRGVRRAALSTFATLGRQTSWASGGAEELFQDTRRAAPLASNLRLRRGRFKRLKSADSEQMTYHWGCPV